jgi:large subunit ribosomal protein L17
MFRNMVTSLLKYERIQTTGAKAKELRRWADHLITLAKRGDLHARRQALAIVREKDVVHKLFEQAAERFGAVSGGYTRVVKLGRRPGDAAPVSLVELVYSQDTKKKKTKKKKAKAGATSPKAADVSKAAADEKKPKSVKSKAAEDDKKEDAEVKAEKASEKKTKAASTKKAAVKEKPAEAKKEDKPKKETKEKKDSTKKNAEDEK